MRELAWRCLKEKTFVLNGFYDFFVRPGPSEESQAAFTKMFPTDMRDGTGMAYRGKIDYKPDKVVKI
jgi:hypothetical protein